MSLDCIISVTPKARGRARKTVNGPVSRFIRDDEDYYQAVLKHLKECRVCDPAEALRGFLKNRRAEKFGGRVSGLLLNMAAKYVKNFRHRGEEIDALYREYLVGHFSSFHDLEEARGLTVEEVRRAHSMYMTRHEREVRLALESEAGPKEKKKRAEPHPFDEAQSRMGWKDEVWPREALGRIVPVDLQFYASLSEEEAEDLGPYPLAVWLVTRHSWETAIREESVIAEYARLQLAQNVMDS